VQRRSPLEAGLALVPLFAPLAALAPLAGRLTSRIGSRIPVAAGLGLAAVGLGLLQLAGARTSYSVLLPALLLWGVGLAVLTPAVVAAAIAAVPGERAGLASAINNTARQASGAIGIAVAGAVAGAPAHVGRFLHGFHIVGAGGAALYVLVAGVALARIPGR
jgi:DHA2 family methylenomycin A resistance protein-like MFS transporter